MTSEQNKLHLAPLNEFNISIMHHTPHNFNIHNEPSSHIHEDYEIYLNLSGNTSFIVENRTYSISRGSIIITKPYEYHHCIFHDNKEHDHYCLQFSVNSDMAILERFLNREKGMNNHIALDKVSTNLIQNHFDALIHSDDNSIMENYYHFMCVLHIVQDNSCALENDILEKIPEALSNALDLISNNYSGSLSVAEIAACVFVSVNTLERMFKQYLQISPAEYISRKRLSEALSMLKKGMSVSQVAYQCGFSNSSTFIQKFKYMFGETPHQYIKNNYRRS